MAQASQPIVATTGGRRIIERPRLLKLLDEASARTILLIAPAGYGKTTLARQWAERESGAYWYTARAGSADIAQLVMGLAEALDPAVAGLHEYVSQLVRAMPNPTQNATEIAEGIANFAGDLSAMTIVIDDHHVVAENETASAMLRTLQERLGFRLVVTSRLRPTWATARLQMYGELLELGSDELALTDEEAIEVLGETARRNADLVERARGWPAVVSLAAQANTARSPTDDTASTLFRFFAEELFHATSPTLQEQLITLALLPRLSRELVEATLGGDPQPVIDQSIECGFASPSGDSAELHPLVRDYLLTKLLVLDDKAERIRFAVELSMDQGLWDHAFELVARFDATDLLDPLIEASFKSLVSSGRIATLEAIARFAHVSAGYVSPLVELIDAELAFRNGLFSRAEAVAARAAKQLSNTHAFSSHAWWIAGQGAQLSFDDDKASLYFDHAKEAAADDEDLREALWGLTITHCQSESPSASNIVSQLLDRRDRSPVDLIRATAAEIHLERIVGSSRAINVDEAIHALEDVGDPRIRTSFMNATLYYSILRGHYDEASEIAEEMRVVADAFQLNWARPHAHWALAAIALGRRQFGVANNWLRRVEQAADELRFGPLILNSSCLRARMFLALQQPEAAWSALTVDETMAVNRGMRGEFLAVKALTLAVLNRDSESRELANEALALTNCPEARAYSACARAVLVQRRGASHDAVTNTLGVVDPLGWDALISGVRAWPPLLSALSEVRTNQPSLAAALRRSYDYDLARRVGIGLGRRPRHAGVINTLSPREGEILELIRQGFTNAEIARALFISESTVKVHVRHILEKTGARSRTEAATAL
jgi:ATP/maltotriose-dependent transcriptional regulator MalT